MFQEVCAIREPQSKQSRGVVDLLQLKLNNVINNRFVLAGDEKIRKSKADTHKHKRGRTRMMMITLMFQTVCGSKQLIQDQQESSSQKKT